MEHEYEEKVCEFKKYAKQTLDLMIDAYKNEKNMIEEISIKGLGGCPTCNK